MIAKASREILTRLSSVSSQKLSLGLVSHPPGDASPKNPTALSVTLSICGCARGFFRKVLQKGAIAEIDDGVGRLGRRLTHDEVGEWAAAKRFDRLGSGKCWISIKIRASEIQSFQNRSKLHGIEVNGQDEDSTVRGQQGLKTPTHVLLGLLEECSCANY